MASYTPPTENLPTFDPTVFRQITDALTIEDGDLRYLRFPTGQGAEYIPSLTVGGASTLASATVTGALGAGSISTAGTLSAGASTLTSVITDAQTGTGVGTAVNLYTEVARTGTIQIGGVTATGIGRIINIGTTSGSGTNTINIGGSAITVGSANTSTLTVNPDAASALRLGNNMTGGSIVMGGTTGGTTTIAIGNGTAQTGAISIGTGNTASALPITIGNQTGAFGTVDIGTKDITIGKTNTDTNNIQTSTSGTLNLKTTTTGGAVNIGTSMTSGTITLGGTTGGSSTLTVNRPIAPAYLPSAIGATNIGYIATPTATSLTTITTSAGNIAQFSLDAGVWNVNVRVRMTNFVAFAGNFFRFSLSTTSATQSTYINDWLADNATGAVNLLVNGRFSLSATTTIYVVGTCAGGIGTAPATTTTNADVQALRIA